MCQVPCVGTGKFHNNDRSDSEHDGDTIRAGGEVGLWQVGFFRIGWADDITAGLGLGAKIHHARFRIDYAIARSEESYFFPETNQNKFSVLTGWEW